MTLRTTLMALMLTALCARAAGACGLSSTCNDVRTSISGDVIFEGFRVSWGSNDAGSAVDHFEVLRYPLGNPGMVHQVGSDVDAYNDCASHGYSLDDLTVTSGDWVYVVQTWGPADPSPACAYEIPAEIP